MRIVADASPLIFLSKVGKLALLDSHEILIAEQVRVEIAAGEKAEQEDSLRIAQRVKEGKIRDIDEPISTNVPFTRRSFMEAAIEAAAETIDAASGKKETGMALSNLRIYASLDTGKIVAIDMETRKVAWDYQSDMSLAAPPLLSEGILYLGGVSGKIQYLEVLE
mgnify:CR=1 FL=1